MVRLFLGVDRNGEVLLKIEKTKLINNSLLITPLHLLFPHLVQDMDPPSY